MKYIHGCISIAVVIALVMVSGCSTTSFGNQQAGNFGGAGSGGFGSTAGQQAAAQWFMTTYGDPRGAGTPTFIEPMVSTNVVDSMPVDKVTAFTKNTDKIFFWVFYEHFTMGDTITMNMVYTTNGNTVLSSTQPTGGEYGAASGSVSAPSGGWPVGNYQVTFSGRGATKTDDFTVIDGATTTVPLPYSGAVQTTQMTPTFTFVSGAPSCNNDAIKNGDETDVDCGGSLCPKCTDNKKCIASSDCTSSSCVNDICKSPSCTDAIKNGIESDVDCGGSCQKCADNKICNAPSDCTSGSCTAGICGSNPGAPAPAPTLSVQSTQTAGVTPVQTTAAVTKAAVKTIAPVAETLAIKTTASTTTCIPVVGVAYNIYLQSTTGNTLITQSTTNANGELSFTVPAQKTSTTSKTTATYTFVFIPAASPSAKPVTVVDKISAGPAYVHKLCQPGDMSTGNPVNGGEIYITLDPDEYG
jgi:hypothetical protein